jgi:hypothetical protein
MTLYMGFVRREKAGDIAQDDFQHGRTEFQIDIFKLKAKLSKDLLAMSPGRLVLGFYDSKDQGPL